MGTQLRIILALPGQYPLATGRMTSNATLESRRSVSSRRIYTTGAHPGIDSARSRLVKKSSAAAANLRSNKLADLLSDVAIESTFTLGDKALSAAVQKASPFQLFHEMATQAGEAILMPAHTGPSGDALQAGDGTKL